MVGQALSQLHAGVAVQYCWLQSEGDQHPDVPLAQAGGKGLFARAIERALLEEKADVAVHSLKDLPVPETPGLCLVAVPPRHDVRDCLVTATGAMTLKALPLGTIFGTASPRRAAQIKLRKVLVDRVCDATLLAVAGLQRSGLEEHATRIVEPEVMLPAACQGALALQCRRSDHVTISRCLPLNDASSAAAVHLERAIVAGLNGDCRSPIAALAQPEQRDGRQGYRLRVRAIDPQGTRAIEADDWIPHNQLNALAKRVLAELITQGAAELVRGA
jgi:hydroxymethylbilane synthase